MIAGRKKLAFCSAMSNRLCYFLVRLDLGYCLSPFEKIWPSFSAIAAANLQTSVANINGEFAER